MDSITFLTAFLVAGGAFTFWCSLKNDDWFFNFPGPSQALILVLGRPAARIFYLLFSLVLLGWGVVRMVDPPRRIPVAFIDEVARPGGVNLTDGSKALPELHQKRAEIRHLQTDATGWTSFWWPLHRNLPYYADAQDSSLAGPDFSEGFHFRKRSVGNLMVEGRVLYFDANRVSCDNWLFSSHPLSSAAFAVVICTPEASQANGFSESLAVFYCRANTPLYQRLFD